MLFQFLILIPDSGRLLLLTNGAIKLWFIKLWHEHILRQVVYNNDMTKTDTNDAIQELRKDIAKHIKYTDGRIKQNEEQMKRDKQEAEKRFEQNEKTIERIDKRIEQNEKHIERIDEIIEHNEKTFERIDKRFEQNEKDAREFRESVAKNFLQTNNHFDELRQEITSLHNKFDVLQETMDGIAGDYTKLVDENAAGAYSQRQLTDKVDNHETRIEKLELNRRAA